MKRVLYVLFTVVCLLLGGVAFFACGTDENNNNEELIEITGVTFTDETIVYDGLQHEILVKGNIPEGVTVTYSNNKGTDSMLYSATAVLSGKDYKTLELTAVLDIIKAEFNNFTFVDLIIPYDGKPHANVVNGDIPPGTKVVYMVDGGRYEEPVYFTERGSHDMIAILENENYNTKIMFAKFVIE